MQKKHSLKWFTLLELMVVVFIIWFLGVSVSNFKFSRLNDKQLVSIELVKIENILSEVRDNALVGRWVWANLDVPLSWNIDVATSSSGTIRTSYLTGATATATGYNLWSWNAPNLSSIQILECIDFLWNTLVTNSATLSFTWSNIDISNGCVSGTNNYKVLNITYGKWTLTWSVSINTVSWTINTN